MIVIVELLFFLFIGLFLVFNCEYWILKWGLIGFDVFFDLKVLFLEFVDFGFVLGVFGVFFFVGLIVFVDVFGIVDLFLNDEE